MRYVIGDIHGCFRTFRTMVEDKLHLSREDTLFLLGDYIDRGNGSKMVVDYIIKLQEDSYGIIPLMGNHEFMLLKSFESQVYFSLWIQNGCLPTLISFGVKEEDLLKQDSVFSIPKPYIEFFSTLRFYEKTKDYFLVHAGVGEFLEDPEEDIETLLWTRDEIYDTDLMAGLRIIHGHTPLPLTLITERVNNPESMIYNLDGGCVYKHMQGMGNLVAMDLDHRTLYIQENID